MIIIIVVLINSVNQQHNLYESGTCYFEKAEHRCLDTIVISTGSIVLYCILTITLILRIVTSKNHNNKFNHV